MAESEIARDINQNLQLGKAKQAHQVQKRMQYDLSLIGTEDSHNGMHLWERVLVDNLVTLLSVQ